MQNTLEEMELTQHSNEQEQQPEPPETTASSEPEEAKPETQEQEVTALIPAEPEVIEGEFVEIEPQETTEDHRPGCTYSGWKSTELRTSHGISTCSSCRS